MARSPAPSREDPRPCTPACRCRLGVFHALARTTPALSTGLATRTAISGETFAIFREQRSSAYSTMIMVPPGPGKTDHLMPGTSACARTHRDMSCLVVMFVISVTPVITASLLSGACTSARGGHGDG